MNNKTTPCLISTAICLLAIICSVCSQCCDFASSTCEWSSSQWKTAPNDMPNLDNYPEFDQTKPSDDYTFIQDASGTDTSISTFHIDNVGVVISFDYYLNAYDPRAINNRLEVFFESEGFTFILGVFITLSSYWQKVQIQCNSLNSYCCPDNNIPCDGTIKISALVDSAYAIGLFAVDNIGVGCPTDATSTTITSIATTTTSGPPSPPTTCCDFNTDICGASGSSWYWSKNKLPSKPIPPNKTIDVNIDDWMPNLQSWEQRITKICYAENNIDRYSVVSANSNENDHDALSLSIMNMHGGDYIWTDSTGQLQFVESVNIPTDATISLSYYISSPSLSLQITFYPDHGTVVALPPLTSSSDNWIEDSMTCPDCCGMGAGTQCDGTFTISITGLTTDAQVAIDNFNIDDQCTSRTACCLFDNDCGYDYDGSLWKLSKDAPSPDVPDPGSEYIYYAPSISPEIVALTSPAVTIDSDTQFLGNFYVHSTDSQNTFKVFFINNDKAIEVLLGTVPDTGAIFRVSIYDCAFANCCAGVASCTGTIQFKVQVEDNAPTDVFAVDAFEIADSCEVFPDSSYDAYNVHNGRKRLKFY